MLIKQRAIGFPQLNRSMEDHLAKVEVLSEKLISIMSYK